MECFEKAIAIDPNNVYSWYMKGVCAGRVWNGDEAMACFHKTLSLDPQHHMAWYQLGSWYMRRSQFEQALECLDKHLELSPNDKRAQDARERAYAKVKG